jgi:hypothetical protein
LKFFFQNAKAVFFYSTELWNFDTNANVIFFNVNCRYLVFNEIKVSAGIEECLDPKKTLHWVKKAPNQRQI